MVPLRRRLRHRLPYLAAAACLVVAAVAGGLAVNAQQEADQQRARSTRAEARASELSALMSAPDATFRSAHLKGGGTGTVVASERQGRTAFVYHGLPALSGFPGLPALVQPRRLDGVRRSGPDRPGLRGRVLLTGALRGADGVGVTAEPQGGSREPTSPPLAILPV